MTDAPLAQSISYHSWNKDRSQLAISPNTDEGQPSQPSSQPAPLSLPSQSTSASCAARVPLTAATTLWSVCRVQCGSSRRRVTIRANGCASTCWQRYVATDTARLQPPCAASVWHATTRSHRHVLLLVLLFGALSLRSSTPSRLVVCPSFRCRSVSSSPHRSLCLLFHSFRIAARRSSERHRLVACDRSHRHLWL